jgi:undecaprenyl-diphosphatase
MSIFQAVILAIIEGITEFLPVSSTGHMIVGESVMRIHSDFTKTFTVAIQMGAIVSVLFLYWKNFLKSLDFYKKLLIAFIPAVVFGLLLSNFLDELLENVLVVGITLFSGGIVFLFVDHWFEKTETTGTERIENTSALKIGLFQCIAMIPGVSRSAATIIGGLTQKLNRKTATEFSFFLAVPTMFAATVKKLYDFHKHGGMINGHEMKLLALGNLIAFIVAILAIRSFITFLTKHGFKLFGYYRIAIGLIIILVYFLRPGYLMLGHE